jgi:hypothetical protein
MKKFCFTLLISNRVLDFLLHADPHTVAFVGQVVSIQYVRLSYPAVVHSNACEKY